MYFSVGRAPTLHIMNLMYIVSRLIFHFITDQYILSLFVIGFGSGFYPIGLRVGCTLGKRLSNIPLLNA